MNATLLRCSIIAALGGLLFGFDTAVISGTTDHLRQVFDLQGLKFGFEVLGFEFAADWQGFQLGLTVASALIGTIVGAFFAGIPADRIGRRSSLVWIAFLYFVSAVGSAVAWDWVLVPVLPVAGRAGRRRLVGRRSHVHCRNLAA